MLQYSYRKHQKVIAKKEAKQKWDDRHWAEKVLNIMQCLLQKTPEGHSQKGSEAEMGRQTLGRESS